MKSAACFVLLALALVACERRDHAREAQAAQERPPAAEPEAPKRIIDFAPVAMGPLAASFADGRQVFASDLAKYIDQNVEDGDGQTPENLPESDAQDWSRGPVPAATGAYLVVLTRVLEVKRETPSGPQSSSPVTVTVEMKALDPADPAGAPVFYKKARGRSSGESMAKLMGDASKPESIAAWDACSTLVAALANLVSEKSDGTAPPSSDMVVVEFDPDPSRCDVLIDGAYVNTTPFKMELTRKTVTVRIERAGYQPWERRVTIAKDLRIQPVLARVGDASPSGALAPAPMPDATAPVGAAPAAGQPTPKRAEVDPTDAPPMPDQLVVPEQKHDDAPAPKADAAPKADPAPAPKADAAPSPTR